MSPKILITGANGQIGQVLTKALRTRYGVDNVLATDLNRIENNEPFEFLDILDTQKLRQIIDDHSITQVYHLAALLSASGEKNPLKTWDINLNAFLALLEAAKDKKLEKIFFPSTIAVFGKTTPRTNTPQDVPLMPSTVYGMSKATGEMWCQYYFDKFGVDVRSLRYPGIIGWQTLPGGGTTDYAVEIYHEALKTGNYSCFLNKDTRLPMMYMDDAIKATIELMEADSAALSVRYGYNISAMSFSPEEIYQEIKKHLPDFTISYNPDYRDDIARSWTESIDSSVATGDWGWKPDYDLAAMTKDMLDHLNTMYSK